MDTQPTALEQPLNELALMRPEWWQSLAPSLSVAQSGYCSIAPMHVDAASASAIGRLMHMYPLPEELKRIVAAMAAFGSH